MFASPDAGPRERLRAALVALIDSFAELRPQVIACVEAIASAVRSEALRAKLAAGYAQGRQAGVEMIHRACADMGIEPPEAAGAVSSVLIAISDGLMLQWLADPDATPDARQTLDALTLLIPFLSDHDDRPDPNERPRSQS